MKLIDPTDDQLNACFAEKVAGFTMHLEPGCEWRRKEIPRFTQSADAVLPWLEKWKTENRFYVQINMLCSSKGVDVYLMGDHTNAESLPMACVIALLRAHGVEVEFSK